MYLTRRNLFWPAEDDTRTFLTCPQRLPACCHRQVVTRLSKRVSRARGSKPCRYRSEPEGEKKSEGFEGAEVLAGESTVDI